MALQMQIYAFLHHRSRHKHIREEWRVKSAYKPLTVVRLAAGVPCRTVQAAEFAPGVKAIIKRLANNLLTQRFKCLDGCREITQYQRILEFRRHPFNKLQIALLGIAALGYTVKFSKPTVKFDHHRAGKQVANAQIVGKVLDYRHAVRLRFPCPDLMLMLLRK